MKMNHRKYIVIFSIPLRVLTLLTILNPLGQPVYAASAPTSGYNRGCSDAQISNPADRYINQPENGPGFHSKAFMQAYNEGYNSCTTQESNNISSSPLVSPDTVSEAPSVNPDNQVSFEVAIIIAMIIITCLVLGKKLITRGKPRERQHFSDSVEERVLKNKVIGVHNVTIYLT